MIKYSRKLKKGHTPIMEKIEIMQIREELMDNIIDNLTKLALCASGCEEPENETVYNLANEYAQMTFAGLMAEFEEIYGVEWTVVARW